MIKIGSRGITREPSCNVLPHTALRHNNRTAQFRHPPACLGLFRKFVPVRGPAESSGIIAATGFVRLPEGPQRRRNTVSPVPCSQPCAVRRNNRAVNGTARRASLLADGFHLLPFGNTAVDSVSIKFDSYGLWIEAVREIPEPHTRVGCHESLSSFRRSVAPPISVPDCFSNQPFACPLRLYWRPQVVSGSSRKIVLLGVFAHCAIGGEARRQLAMLSRIRLTHAAGMPLSSRA